MALWGVCLNEIALVLLCVAMLLVQKTRVTLSTIGYKTKVEVITTWSPASTRASGNLVGFVFLALQNNSFLLIGHFLFAKALSVSGFGDYFNLLLFRHLETEYIRHCIPSNVSSGLSSLPLPYMYVDEIAKSDQPTTQELPSRDRLSGAQTYLKLISVFTTLVCIAGKTETYLTGKVGRTFVPRECHMNYLKPKISEEGRYGNDVWALTL